MARREKILEFGELSVRVTELTVEQVINFADVEEDDFKPILWLTGEQEVPQRLLSLLTDLSQASVRKLSFSELKAVIEAVKEVNKDLFFVLEQLGMLAGLMAGSREKPSSKPSVSSSGADTMTPPATDGASL